MQLLSIVQELENKTSQQRLTFIQEYLSQKDIVPELHFYTTGLNLWVKSPQEKFIGIGTHYDIVPNTGAANDNASSIAVALDILERYQNQPTKGFGLQFFFFDEEEVQLKGSRAYCQEYGIDNIAGLFNLEMVGQGDKFALWALNENSEGKLLKAFEEISQKRQIQSYRFDRIVTNYADHLSFREAGLGDESFTITCISDKDLEVAEYYYKALNDNANFAKLQEIISQAPLFKHYHKASDLSIHLSEDSLQMTSDTLWETIQALDTLSY